MTAEKQNPSLDQQWLNPMELFSWWAMAAVSSAGMLVMLSMYSANVDNHLDIGSLMFGARK